jgi:hypothetical protein
LTVSIVTYRPDLALLDRTLRTLAVSLVAAREQELMRAANVVLVDNTGTRASAAAVIKVAREIFHDADVTMNYLHGHAKSTRCGPQPGRTAQHELSPCPEPRRRALADARRPRSGFSTNMRHRRPGCGIVRETARGSTSTNDIRRYSTWRCAAARAHEALVPRARPYRCDLVDRVAIDETISPIPVASGSFMFVRRKRRRPAASTRASSLLRV